ncbi:MAG: DUF1592 domain-containing protein, partial [Verrucomicrobia bacterium]|nr:DUF1592 domain-containing protein [Verrucomicrobiota bacterium]
MTTWFRFLSVLIPFFLWVGEGLFGAPFAMPEKVDDLMANYCFDCHDDETRKGEVRLDNLATLALKDRLDLLNRVQEQIFIKEMPPRKKKTQPSDSERQQLYEWMSAELRKHSASKLEEKLRYPGYGNYLDHQKLFSGEIKDKPFSPSRRWLVSPRIFHERVMNVLRLTDHERRGFSTLQFDGVKNPFMLPERSGVRDYDVTTLDGGHLLVMLSNAKWIAGKQLFSARLKTPQKEDLLKALSAKDRWYPEVTPEAFERIVLKAELPTNEEMNAAVEEQFDCVLMRRPTKEELAKYVDLLRSSIALAGNSEGLRQMLFAVLLESDFLYRMELGGGEPDEFGRHKLTPQEGSLAIAYALGDRSPDPELTKAVEEGRFESKDDYRREVERLLADENYYKGPVDHKISGKNMRSHETSHPKIVRFFREFFGYPKAAKIFKDIERSDGYYQNPGRGTLGTPGFLIKEADRVVDWYLKKDKNVFENLLTTEEFFVYHDKD